MNLPNFFIIGAPKCGTTSLAVWLGEHPQAFVSSFKEPHFFNDDHSFINTPSWEHYRSLFKDAEPRHAAVGEASVWYLYSLRAVPNILRAIPDARFIVLLRNPVDMACSLHEQQLYSGQEHIRDFKAAWDAQTDRQQGRRVSSFCREPKHLLYGDVCSLGAQMERLYAHAPRGRVLPLLLDDLIESPRREYLRVLDFLGLDDDGRERFASHNPAKVRRFRWLVQAARMVNRLKLRLGLWNVGLGLMKHLDRVNTTYRSRPQLEEGVRRELEAYFQNDVHRLSRVLGRDVTHWVEA